MDEIIETKGVSREFAYICEVALLHFFTNRQIIKPHMKHLIVLLFAAVFFSTMTSSCAKKTDDKTTMDMAKPDSMSNGGNPAPAPNNIVTIAPPRVSGGYQGIMVTGAGAAPAKVGTFTVTPMLGHPPYIVQALYGPNTNAENSIVSTPAFPWTQGPDSLPVFWYPTFRGSGNPPNPSTWWGYDTIRDHRRYSYL